MSVPKCNQFKYLFLILSMFKSKCVHLHIYILTYYAYIYNHIGIITMLGTYNIQYLFINVNKDVDK